MNEFVREQEDFVGDLIISGEGGDVRTMAAMFSIYCSFWMFLPGSSKKKPLQ